MASSLELVIKQHKNAVDNYLFVVTDVKLLFVAVETL